MYSEYLEGILIWCYCMRRSGEGGGGGGIISRPAKHHLYDVSHVGGCIGRQLLIQNCHLSDKEIL